MLAAQAWHCFVARDLLGDDAVGCDSACSSCRYFKAVVKPIGASLEMDAQACAVSRGGVLLGANSQLCALLQRPQAEVVGFAWSDLAAVEDLQPLLVSEQDPSSVAATRVRRLEGHLVRKRGGQMPVAFMVAPFARMWGALLVRVEAR